MARLNRQPCTTCDDDTIHEGPTCTACGTIVVMVDRSKMRNAIIKDAIRRKFRPDLRAERRERIAARKAANVTPFHDLPTTRGPWGGGRERTKA